VGGSRGDWSEDKRRLFVKVATAAIRGDAEAEVDELQFLLRTLARSTRPPRAAHHRSFIVNGCQR
jgi:hypothetical protein